MPIKRGKQIRPERPLTFLIHSNAHDTGHLSHGGGGVRLSEAFNLKTMNKGGSKVILKKALATTWCPNSQSLGLKYSSRGLCIHGVHIHITHSSTHT